MADLKAIISSATEETSPDINADRILAWIAGSDTLEGVEIATILGAALAVLRTAFTAASSSGPASLQLHEDTDNGTNKVTIAAPSSLGSDRSWVFPDAAGTFASQSYVDAAVVGLLEDKGNTDCSANPNYPAASKGDVYTVSVAGKIGGASGVTVEVGDWFRAIADNAGGTQAGVGTSWAVVQANLVGAYVAGGTDVPVADGGTGASTAAGARTNLGLEIGTDVAPATPSVNAQTGTTYTLDATDNGKIVTCSNASAITVTVPVSLGAGFHCQIIQLGAGQVTFAASGTTINNRQSHTKIAGQYGVAVLAAYASNVFALGGDTAA